MIRLVFAAGSAAAMLVAAPALAQGKSDRPPGSAPADAAGDASQPPAQAGKTRPPGSSSMAPSTMPYSAMPGTRMPSSKLPPSQPDRGAPGPTGADAGKGAAGLDSPPPTLPPAPGAPSESKPQGA